MTKLRHIASIGALLFATTAAASDGTRPSKIEQTLLAADHGIREARVIVTAGALSAVLEVDASAAGNPEGITLIRGGNHKITTPAGNQLDLLRAVSDAAGNVFITYASPNQQFGLRPITRRIKPDNTLGFEKTFNIERDAGIAPDGTDGVYLAGHVPYNLPGQFVTTMTHHRTYRLSPTGEVVWQVEAAGQKQPTGASQFVTTAAANADGVFLGYGVGDGSDGFGLIPVIGHRQASDGAELYTRVGLKKPAPPGAVALPPGSIGRTAIAGWVETIVIGSDGSAIASVRAQPSGMFVVRLDATGTQTDAYACNGDAQPFAAGEIACVRLQDKLEVTRFGIANGRLAQLSKWSADKPAGTTQTAWTVLPGRQVLVAGLKDGKTSLRMYSTAGNLMTTWGSPIAGNMTTLGALGGKWLGYGPEAPPNWVRYTGTYVVGGAAAPASMPKANMPKLPH